MEDNKFKIKNEDGKEVLCEVLFTFESDETNKNYMVYTDNTKDDSVGQGYMHLYIVLMMRMVIQNFYQLRLIGNGRLLKL